MPPDPLILAFDTSAAHCAVALLSGDTILASQAEEMSKGQAERLFPLLEDVLSTAGKNWQDLDAIGCGTGPGNFTGIRLSVSAARGLALSLGIPAIGVNTLEALLLGATEPALATIDARRNQVYLLVSGAEPSVISTDQIGIDTVGQIATCIGHNAGAFAQVLGASIMAPSNPIAVAIAKIAFSRLALRISRPAPLYLKPADAAPSSISAPVLLQ